MVVVSSAYAKDYPNLVAFVVNDLPKIVQKPKIYEAFCKYAEYTRFMGRTAFWPTADPMIYIEDPNRHSTPDEYVFAKYKSVTPRYIFVDTAWARRFEKDVQSPALSAKAKLLMEACILHEMCHRGDWHDGQEQPVEVGEEFERPPMARCRDATGN